MTARAVIVAAAFAAAACRQTAPAAPALRGLDEGFEPLRAQFNADASRVRVLALLSPT
jgi:hypothetical protein